MKNDVDETIVENVPGLSPVRPRVDGPKSRQRSRIGNGSALLPDIDGRSGLARRFKDIAAALLADQSGATECSEARKQLIRRFAAASCLAEQLESRLVNGETIDISEHAALSSTLVRLAARIGIDRRSRDVTPSLADYISGLNTREAAR